MLRPRFIGVRPAELAELRRAAREIGRRRGHRRGRVIQVRPSPRGGRTVVFDGITRSESGIVLEAMTRVNLRQLEAGAFTTRPIGKLIVVGQTAPVMVYELLGRTRTSG